MSIGSFWREGTVQHPEQEEEEEDKARKTDKSQVRQKEESSIEEEEDGRGSWIIDKLPILLSLF